MYVTNKGYLCEIEGCGLKAYCKKLCPRHYSALRRHGDPNHPIRGVKEFRQLVPCIIEGCIEMVAEGAGGLCIACYKRDWSKRNKPEVVVGFCLLEGCCNPIPQGRRKFCSVVCLKKSQLKPVFQGICPECGAGFTTPLEHQIYCSRQCRVKVAGERARKKAYNKKLLVKICGYCEKLFETVREDKIYCSSSCSGKESRRLYRLEHPLPSRPWTISQKPPGGMAAIYQFVDKITKQTRYIGSTLQAPNKRRMDHPKERRDACDFEVLCLIPLEQRQEVEWATIQEALAEGHPLENKLTGLCSEYKAKNEKTEERVCLTCGAVFMDTKIGPHAKYCSKECKPDDGLIKTTAKLNDWVPSNMEAVIEDFMARVNIDQEGCWLWMGNINDKGYGRATFSKYGVSISAHILSFRLFHGPIENQINHRCNIAACCNPEHLYDGTQQENLRDQWLAGNRPHDMSGL